MSQEKFCEYLQILRKRNMQMAMRKWNDTFLNMKTNNLNETVLHEAVEIGDPEIVTFILNKGIKVDKCDRYRRTALQIAAYNNNEKVTKILIDHGANVNLCENEGRSALHLAAYNDNEKVTKILIEHGANVNLCENRGRSALHIAAVNGHEKVTAILIEHGANVNLCDNYGWFVLHIATYKGRDKVTAILVEHGANVNLCDNNGCSALHIAVCKGYEKITKIFIEHGANIDLCSNEGYSALYAAACIGYEKITEILIEHGASVNLCSNEGSSALYAAAHNGHEKVTAILIEHGASVNFCDNKGYSALYAAACNGHKKVSKILIEHDVNVNHCRKFGSSALHLAVTNGFEKVTETLIEYGENVNLCDNKGRSALYVAVCSGNVKVIKILIEHGADVNLCDNNGWNALHRAADNGNKKVTQILIKHGANVNLCDKNQYSALYIAVCNGHEKVTKMLIDHGADVNLCDNDGWSALHRSADNDFEKVTKILIEHGAKVNLRDDEGRSALHIAADNGYEKITDILIQHGADVNLCDKEGRSALHVAARKGYEKITEILIEHGVNVNLCDEEGRSALQFAAENGFEKVTEILLGHGANVSLYDETDFVQTDNIEEFKRYAMNGLKLTTEIVNLIGQVRPAKIIEYIVSSPVTEEEIAAVPEVWQGEPLMREINLCRAIESAHGWLFENSVSIELINKELLIVDKHALQLAIDSSQSEIMINEVIKLLKYDNDILGTILDTYEGRNDVIYLNILRKRKCALDEFTKRGYSRLDMAVMDCSKKMLLYLLENENDAKVITQALAVAIERNCEKCVRILSNRNNVDYSSYVNKLGQTLLHLVVESGNTAAICHTLVDKCCTTDLTTKDYFGLTALQRAVIYNKETLVDRIINKNKCWNTTLHIAKPKEVTFVVGSSAKQKIRQKKLHTIFGRLTEKETTLSLQVKANNDISEAMLNNISECDVQFLDGLRNSILHTAVSNCNIEVCKTIIGISRSTVSMTNIDNISPLRLAVRMMMANKSAIIDDDKIKILNIIQYLIGMGAQLEQNDPAQPRSILQEAITFADEKLLIELIEGKEPVTALTENEFKFIIEKHFFTFLYHLTATAAGKLPKQLASRLITDENVIMHLFQSEQYCTLIHLFPHLNGAVRKRVMNEYLYMAYEQRNEDLFTKLCDVEECEFEVKLLNNNSGETIMTHIIKDDDDDDNNNKTYILHLLEAKYIQQLANTANYCKELPIHLIVKRKWLNVARLLLKENEIVDEENAEGDTAIAILIKQLADSMEEDKEETNEILYLIYTMIDHNFELRKVSTVSGRSPISYGGGKYRYKIEQYYERRRRQSKAAVTQKQEKSFAGAVGGGGDSNVATTTATIEMCCHVCRDREVNCVLDCGHTFCTECIDKVDKCPNCRHKIENPRKMHL